MLTQNKHTTNSCPSQVEGLTRNRTRELYKDIRSLCSRTCWEPQIQIPTRSVQKSGHVVLSISRFRSHTCLVFRTEQINNRGRGDLQSLWPASSENVLAEAQMGCCGVDEPTQLCWWFFFFLPSPLHQKMSV